MSIERSLRIRTLTAGIDVAGGIDLQRFAATAAALKRLGKTCRDAGYEVQTLRIATSPWPLSFGDNSARAMLSVMKELDAVLAEGGVIGSIGPLPVRHGSAAEMAAWAAELIATTRTISFSVAIATDRGVESSAATCAAKIMKSLATAVPAGLGNFRFAAAANVPAGTPFFPVAWHRGADSLAVGLEAASVIEDAFAGSGGNGEWSARIATKLDQILPPIETMMAALAEREQRVYLGIDTSPAPGQDRSIAAAIEAMTRSAFGNPGTLEACAAITAALRSVAVKTCGYSGLMLPVLEDPLLSQRAGEGRYGIRELLLYSSVCGTGLDVVPIPGDTPVEAIAALLRDVGALSVRLRKPLSARLFLVPGKAAGELAHFDDPLLSDCVVMKVA
jgi:uncharacterized protein (UPF0210 family)